MHLCLTGPIATADVAHLLDDGGRHMPAGYAGAPLMGVLATELVRQGHRVHAVSTDNGLPLQPGRHAQAQGQGFSLTLCPARRRAWRFNGALPGRALDAFGWERRELAQAIRGSGAELVHAHWSYEFALAAQAAGMPMLLTCHDAPGAVLAHSRTAYRVVRWLMARTALRQARHLSTVSDYMAGALARYTGQPVPVVPNPVCGLAIGLGRDRQGDGGRRLALVCNGWGPIKNAGAALEAFARFRLQCPSAELHCFGTDFEAQGPASRWARERRCEAGVWFHGPQPHRNLLAHLSDLDALLHPAQEESFGVVVAEAMALGLPVVAGRATGAVPWVLGMQDDLDSGMPGVLVDVCNLESIAQGLHRVFDDRYAGRSRRGRALALARFAPDAVARAYVSRYAQVIAGRGQGREASLPAHSTGST